jgi:hypothetical protein
MTAWWIEKVGVVKRGEDGGGAPNGDYDRCPKGYGDKFSV